MEFFVGTLIALVTAILVLVVVNDRQHRKLIMDHVLSLGRVQDAVKFNLPEVAAELINAVIDEEIEGM